MQHEDTIIHALLGAGTRYEGKLFFDGRVRIDGDFDGEILSEGLLVVGEGATLRGTVRVGALIVRGGTVQAEIYASELVELHTPAQVRGDIHTPALFIDKGVVFDGSCVMGEVHPLESTHTDTGTGADTDTGTGADTDTGTDADTDYRDQPTRN